MNFGQHYGRVLRNLSYGLLVVLMLAGAAFAEEPVEKKPETPLDAQHANWIFSGSVANEAGETYEYFFQAKRNADLLHATVALIDAQSKAVIFMSSAESQLTEHHGDQWAIGDIFLRYNTINSSWIFGLKKENQLGFNFKVDMLNQPDHDPRLQHLHQGVAMMIAQTGQVNGHLQLKENEAAQFVNGKTAWFRQIVITEQSAKTPELQGLFCRFEDGTGLYSMKMLDTETIHGSFAGLFNGDGVSVAISQFIHVEHLDAGPWRVRVPYPKLQFELADVSQEQAVVLGFTAKKDKPGFCVISQDH